MIFVPPYSPNRVRGYSQLLLCEAPKCEDASKKRVISFLSRILCQTVVSVQVFKFEKVKINAQVQKTDREAGCRTGRHTNKQIRVMCCVTDALH